MPYPIRLHLLPRLPAFDGVKDNLGRSAFFVFRCLVWIAYTRLILAFVLMRLDAPDDGGDSTPAPEIPMSRWISHLVIAPVIETLLFQSAVIEVCRWLGARKPTWYAMAAVPFALLHWPLGWITAVMALASGIWFAHCYCEFRRHSRTAAAGFTMILHSASNLAMPWLVEMLRRSF